MLIINDTLDTINNYMLGTTVDCVAGCKNLFTELYHIKNHIWDLKVVNL